MTTPTDPRSTAQAVARRMAETDAAARGLGVVIEDVGPGTAVVALQATDDMTNGGGMVHGGIVFMLADCAFAVAANSHGPVAVSRSCEIEYLAPAACDDRLVATAVERRRLARGGIYDVTVTRADGTAIAEMRGHARHPRA